MSNATPNRNRWMTPAPKAPILKVAEFLKRSDVWARIGLCAITATILYVVMLGWQPPFSYRVRHAPLRDLHAHTAFQYADFKATSKKQEIARRNFLCFYANDEQPLQQLRQALVDDVFEITQKEFAAVQKSDAWSKFFPADANDNPQTAANEESFNLFREAIAADGDLTDLRAAVDRAFLDIDKNGLLEDLAHEIGDGNMEEIEVFPKGNFDTRHRVSVSKIRIAEVLADLRNNLEKEIKAQSATITDSQLVAQRIFDWLKPRLPVTLTWDEKRSREGAREAAKLPPEQRTIEPGDLLEQDNIFDLDMRGIKAGVPLDENDIQLLRAEHAALVASEGMRAKLVRTATFFGLFAAVFSLICQYMYFRDRHLLDDVKQFSILLAMMMVTLTLSWIISAYVGWRAELVPIVIFSMLVAIAYHIELALILSAAVALVFTVAHGFGLAEFVVLTAASSSAAMMCRRIRSRTKLINVGFVVAAIVFPTVVGVNYMLGQPFDWPLITEASLFAAGAAVSGLIMTGSLPFLERPFDIQTDISLLELSDANHPLLKELVQRAPGTYNHSINVASMSEAAADAIGANGLLCRVGAYFHDVGKLRKPEYFIENQAGGPNKHDDLVPTMSTLVIIAHVKDGVEIAKKHRLPKRIIDLIEQHHGTTLVEYFYKRATQQQEGKTDDENNSQVDESDYRYPGPKPQTPESAVMMIADTVESASRALREPAPARIENLVRKIAKKKFDDGQFDECDITIQQLHIIQESLIKSLNAMYHARVQYPEQQSA